MSRVPCVLPQDPLTSFSGVGALGRCQGIRASDPTLCGPCVSQLKLQADMGHLREEMMKTGRLQARERQTLAGRCPGTGCTHRSPVGSDRPHKSCVDANTYPELRIPARIRIQNTSPAQAGCLGGAGTLGCRCLGLSR